MDRNSGNRFEDGPSNGKISIRKQQLDGTVLYITRNWKFKNKKKPFSNKAAAIEHYAKAERNDGMLRFRIMNNDEESDEVRRAYHRTRIQANNQM